MAFSILDLFREAEGDENQNASPNDAGAAPANDNQNADQSGNADQNNDSNKGGDDFNMDMSLEDDNAGDEGGDETDSPDAGGDDMEDSGGGDMGGGTDEPIEANTDIFYSLTAEEQSMKIIELKRQYSTLFNSCDDLLDKITDINDNENTIIPLSRVSTSLMDLKRYIIDYLYHKFDINSYYENDVKLNEFIAVFHSISEIMKEIYKINIQNE